MSNTQTNQYLPDYLVTPGQVLEDYLDSLSMSQAELATRMGLSKKTVNEIIKGKSPITPETALKLERTLGRPAHFWNNLEGKFQEDRTRLTEQKQLESSLDWLKKVPVKAMVKQGWISGYEEKIRQIEEVLRFFGIASPEQWETVWRQYQVAWRQTKRFNVHEESVSAWLRKGEIQARRIECAPFEKKRFRKTLVKIRDLTRKVPDIFVPELIKECASTGVAVVFVPELPHTGVWGVTRWLGTKPVIQLSLRYKSNDHLWFTFFHEAGHILKHGRKEVFIENNTLNGEKEKEADEFARDLLIPPGEYRRFLISWDGRSLAPVESFARRIAIAPGIVVGRLQFDKRLPPSHGNKLKVRYKWSRVS